MASKLAVQLRHRLEAYLSRGLSIHQVHRCEEIVINFRPWVPLRYLDALVKALGDHHRTSRNWGMFYYPLYAMGHSFRGYFRRSDLVFIRGRFRRIYEKCDLLAGSEFEEKDLAAILFLANNCTDKEIHGAFTIARTYGLRTLRHLRGIVLKNRAVAIQPHLKSLRLDTDEKFKEKISQWVESRYPVVGMMQRLYSFRVHHVLTAQTKLRFTWEEMDELDKGENSDGPAPEPL
jgi:hypothetical protein